MKEVDMKAPLPWGPSSKLSLGRGKKKNMEFLSPKEILAESRVFHLQGFHLHGLLASSLLQICMKETEREMTLMLKVLGAHSFRMYTCHCCQREDLFLLGAAGFSL